MSFISNALGTANNFQVQSGAGPNGQAAINTSQQNYENTYGAQDQLAQQLLAQSQGQGPNIAQLQLEQATNQNNQQAAGAMASQRGMNPALAQRVISQQQAMNNQNAAGQSGILRAQQQLGAQGQLANVYGQQAGEAITNIGTYTAANAAANQANAQIAQNNSNQASGVAGGIISPLASILAKGGKVSDAPKKHLEIMVIPWGPKIHPVHLGGGGFAPTSGDVAIFGPLSTKGGGAGGGMPPLSPGMFASKSNPMAGATSAVGTPGDLAGVGGTGAGSLSNYAGADFGAGAASAGAADAAVTAGAADEGVGGLLLAAAHGAKVPAMISPGERYIPPHLVEKVKKGKMLASHVAPKVPGKAKVDGDSEENDTVPAKLSPGGVVIPRSKANNDADAREFLQAIAEDKKKKEGPQGYNKVLQAKRRKNA